jgi:hypothetical protein
MTEITSDIPDLVRAGSGNIWKGSVGICSVALARRRFKGIRVGRVL